MKKPQDYLRQPFRNLTADELATQPCTALLSISDETAETLRFLGIHTIFDLGVSQLFHTARTLADVVTTHHGPIARFQQIPQEWLDAGVDLTSMDDLPNIPLASLRSLDTNAATRLEESLGISTLDELGRWTPYLAAREIIEGSLAENEYPSDSEIPRELVPRFNEYPTEKFFYSVYTIDSAEPSGGFQPLEGALDLAELETNEQSLKVRTGAIIRYEQAWMPVGLALGNLLHSLALAPGESTRIAMIDWSRRQGVRTSEEITQTERLANSLMHARSINEVTSAVAREAQSGFSQMNANSTVSNTAYSGYGVQNAEVAMGAALAGAGTGLAAGAGAGAVGGAGVGAIAGLAGAGFGAIPGAIGGGLIGAGAGGLVGMAAGGVGGFLGTAEFGASQTSGSETNTEVVTTTSSTGERELAASMAQNINDRTQQHSSSARNRHATIVQEVWQSESEQITTRTVTNYNHMHALTVQYFEVVQMYRLRTSADYVQRALYIPLQSIAWTQQNIVRYRSVLLANSLDARLTTALMLAEGYSVLHSPLYAMLPEEQRVRDATDPWWRDVERLQRARAALGDAIAAAPFDPWVIPDGVVIEEVAVVIHVNTYDDAGNVIEASIPNIGTLVNAAQVIDRPVRQVSRIEWNIPRADFAAKIANNDTPAGRLDISVKLRHEQQSFWWKSKTKLELDAIGDASATLVVAKFSTGGTSQWVTDHLEAFTKHYSRAVWRSIDETDITTLLSEYSFEGQPVIDNIDRKPVAISGQYLVFAYHHKPKKVWDEWLAQHGFKGDTSSIEIVPMPTGGVFAEAVQGRANSAEKLDLTRFWNWQDSPIPLTAPEIAAVQSGSRATDSNLTPGQLQAPIVNNLSAPNVPDPQGMGAVLSAISSGNMFRNMSGIAETRALASDALQQAQAGATAAGEQAASSLANGMAMHSQAIDKILSMFQDLSNQIAGAGFGAMTANLQNVGAKDISSAGAVVNKAAARDAARGTKDGGSGGAPASLEDDAIRTLINGTGPAAFGGGSGGGSISTGGGTVFASTGGAFTAPDLTVPGDQVSPFLWRDLIEFQVPQDVLDVLTSRGMSSLSLGGAAGALVNLDYFPVHVTKLPVVDGQQLTAEQFLEFIRRNLHTNLLISTALGKFAPYAQEDEQIWFSDNPYRSVLRIDLLGPDNAAVVCAESAADHWIFHTVATPDTGAHPVSGQRMFGYWSPASDEVVFYTRGADRVTGIFDSFLSEQIFGGGGAIWTTFQTRVAGFVNSNGGEATVPRAFSGRFSWFNLIGVLRAQDVTTTPI